MIIPISHNTESAELLHLILDRLSRELARRLPNHRSTDRSILNIHIAQPLERLELNGQTMTVPAGNIADLLALTQLKAIDDILQDLVERMANMQFSVRIGRAIVEDEGLVGRSFAALPGVELISASFEVFFLVCGRHARGEGGFGEFKRRCPGPGFRHSPAYPARRLRMCFQWSNFRALKLRKLWSPALEDIGYRG